MTMDGITLMLRSLHHTESGLVHDLERAAQRHVTDHEFHYGAIEMARWSREHVRRLAAQAEGRGLDLSERSRTPGGPLVALREKSAELLGHRPEPALLLLHDLRELHLSATDASVRWEMLAQTAQAMRDEDLLGLITSCHPQTLRQMRWSNTLIKQLAPQTLTAL